MPLEAMSPEFGRQPSIAGTIRSAPLILQYQLASILKGFHLVMSSPELASENKYYHYTTRISEGVR